VLDAVGCQSTICVAVGHSVNRSSATVTLAEVWNGTSWTGKLPSNQSGSTTNKLSAVACGSTTSCNAVGYYVDGSGNNRALAEHWNGSAWTIQSAGVPAGSTSSVLDGIACTGANSCAAVGKYRDFFGNSVTLAVIWNGSGWTAQSTPNPSGATSSELHAISCSAANACTAVGQYGAGGVDHSLAEGWNGTAWALETSVDPAGAASTLLDAVSCPTATQCTAAGYATSSTGTRLTLAESATSGSWAIETTPNPSGATTSELRGLSCGSTSTCVAVGYSAVGSGAPQPLSEVLSGGGWALKPVPNVAGATGGALHGVACTSSTACETAGFANKGRSITLAEKWNGTAWSVQSTPNPTGATESRLHGVSCANATTCVATGYLVNSAGVDATLAEGWNGTNWSIESTPNPPQVIRSTFNSVSCASTTSCAAVGYSVNSAGGDITLAEGLSGTGWTLQATPNLTGARDSLLAGVSCAAANSCIAVGNAVNSSDLHVTLAEAWGGTSWTMQTTPNLSTATGSILRAVSCTAANACTAVGSATTSTGTVTLAEAWNGTAWTIHTTPNVAGATASILDGVSCLGSTCTAVGYSTTKTGAAPLAEVFSAGAWTIQSTPLPSGATGGWLNGVSCPTAGSCSAVGYYTPSGGGSASLAEGSNGTTWTIQSTPAPTGSTAAALDAVSCTAASVCSASGYAKSASSLPLILRDAP
jgi:hypothetical protein